jgi:hypothetical protein
MKKLVLVAAALLAVSLLALSAWGTTGPENDFQAIKKAVKENPNIQPGQEAKWFKVLVTDAKTGKDKVKITLPLVVIDIISKCVDTKDLQMHRPGCNIDLPALFNELKAAGPMMVIELQEKDEIVKVWLE